MNKKTPPSIFAILGLTLLATALPAMAQNATTSTTVVAESTVQYVTGTSPTSFTNYVSGYNKLKYSATQPCKSYFKFDFTGQNPNTNYALRFTWKTVTNTQKQHLKLWALNQAYPAFITNNPTLSWSNAQANATGITDNDMLTSGPATATLVDDFLVAGSANLDVGVTLPAPWGQYLINNQVGIVLTSSNDPTDGNGANGTRLALQSSATPAFATFQPLVGGAPPVITAIPAQTIRSTDNSAPLAFTVSDPEDAAASLTNISISFGNTNVSFTATNIAIGAGGNRTLTFTPVSNKTPGQTATVTVTLILTDSAGNSATSAFLLTVTPFVSLPMVLSGTNVNYIPPTNRVGIGSVTIPFQIVDTNIAASSLVVTGAVSGFTTNLGSLSFTSVPGIAPNTNNCTVTVNATGSGVGIVNLTIINPTNLVTNKLNLAVMVLPDNSYVVYDLMNYQPSTSYSSSSGYSKVFNATANLWAARTTSGSVDMIMSLSTGPSGMPIGVPLVRGSSSGNQNQMRLVGAPYAAGSHKVVYASINAQWADTSAYGTTAAYPGTSTGGFIEFAETGSSTSVAMAAVCTVSNIANTVNNDGSFYLGLYNGTNAPSVDTSLSQAIPNFNTSGVLPSAPVNIVVSYDVDTGISTLWLNQSSSTGTSVTLQDVAVTNLANVNYVVLRQNANMGDIIVSSLAVKVITKPVPTVNGITKSGNNVVISFTSAPGSGGTASVIGSSTVNGTYNPVGSVTINESPASSGNFTASFTVGGSQSFYRIAQTGTTPTVAFPF